MAKNWKDIRADAVSKSLIDEEKVAEHKRRRLAEVRAHRLVEIRDAFGLNQSTVADRLGISQSRVSRIERGDMEHTEVATLRAFIQALGGELEVAAKFGDERITLG